MVFNVKKFKHYLLMNPVVFFVDHMALRYIVNKPNLSGRLTCWVLLLIEFDYIVKYKPGNLQKQVDHLSKLSIELDTGEINDDFLDTNLFSTRVMPTWYEHIIEFLSTQQFPKGLSKNERCKIQVNNTHLLFSSQVNFIARELMASCKSASHISYI
jgi:hypothetical protein